MSMWTLGECGSQKVTVDEKEEGCDRLSFSSHVICLFGTARAVLSTWVIEIDCVQVLLLFFRSQGQFAKNTSTATD